MAGRSLTLLEVHLGDGDVRIGPIQLLGSNVEDPDTPEETEVESGDERGADDTDGSIGKSIGIAALLVGVLAAVGFAAARLLGGDLEDAADLDELAE
ncbi:MAG: hypothetical protein PPP55_10185 [Halorubrum sp.]